MRADRFSALCIVAVLAAFLCVGASGATITVTSLADVVADDGDCTLREAIDNANSDSSIRDDCDPGDGADIINLPPGVILMTLLSDSDDDENVSGDFDVKDDLTIVGISTTINALANGPVFDVFESETFTLNSVIISNAFVSTTVGEDRGAAITANATNIYLEDVTFVDGHANKTVGAFDDPTTSVSAGIFIAEGNLYASNCLFDNNRIDGEGFGNNVSDSAAFTLSNGGAIFSDSIFKGNSAFDDSTIGYVADGSIVMYDCLVESNTVDLGSGQNYPAVFLALYFETGGDFYAENTNFISNECQSGNIIQAQTVTLIGDGTTRFFRNSGENGIFSDSIVIKNYDQISRNSFQTLITRDYNGPMRPSIARIIECGDIHNNVGSLADSTVFEIIDLSGSLSGSSSYGNLVYSDVITVNGIGGISNNRFGSLFNSSKSFTLLNCGDIRDNVAVVQFAYSEGTAIVENVGDIVGNSALETMFYGSETARISNTGSIVDNYGGLLSGSESVLEFVYGNILRNSGNDFGGFSVIYGSQGAHLAHVNGKIANNFQTVVFSESHATMRNVYDVINNEGRYGGVIYGDIVNVYYTGNFINNNAEYGGVVYALDTAFVYNVGDLRGNRATYNGGFGYAEENLFLTSTGAIKNNVAGFGGGVVHAGRDGFVSLVFGDISENSAKFSGGVLYAGASGTLTSVFGDIKKNGQLLCDGGIIYARSFAAIDYVNNIIYNTGLHGSLTYTVTGSSHSIVTSVYGDIVGNKGGTCGAVCSYGNALLKNVYGDIRGNSIYNDDSGINFAFGGAVVGSNIGDAALVNVSGDIYSNSCNNCIGAVIAGYSASIQNAGNLYNNYGAVYGGVACATNGNVVMTNVGYVNQNSAQYGSVAYAASSIIINNVGDFRDNIANGAGTFAAALASNRLIFTNGGNILNNSGTSGLSYSEDNAIIQNVDAIRGNIGTHYAGVSYCAGTCTILDVDGDIANNSGVNGGVIYASTAILSNVGQISSNTASSNGGVLYGQITAISDAGDIKNNSAALNGGVSARQFSDSGVRTTLTNVGAITSNHAGNGGIVYHGIDPFGLVTISNVYGSISYNTGFESLGAISSGYVRVSNVFGSIDHNEGILTGFAYGISEVRIESVAGDLAYNRAAPSGTGGVARCDRDVLIFDVGAIHHNEAGDGSIAQGSENVSVSFVLGGVFENKSHTAAGAVYSNGGTASLTHVFGPVSFNTAITTGAVVSGQAAILAHVEGDVQYNELFDNNVSLRQGGVAFGRYMAVVRNVAGDIKNNAAYNGAVVYAGDFGIVELVSGSILSGASFNGGVIYSAGDAIIAHVGGTIQYNTASGGSGGVIFAISGAQISDVYGAIAYNVADSVGGVVTSRGISMRRVGIIHDNNATDGGVVYSQDDVVLRNTGNIEYNRGSYAGLIYCSGHLLMTHTGRISENISLNYVICSSGDATFSNVYGEVAYNSVQDGSVFYSDGQMKLSRVYGNISHNNGGTGEEGHVFYSDSDLTFLDIYGDITYNKSEYSNFYGKSGMSLGNVGAIAYNSSYFSTFYTTNNLLANFTGTVNKNDNGSFGVFYGNFVKLAFTGDLTNNVASHYYGAVVYAELDCEVSHVFGDIRNNVAGEYGGAIYCGREAIVTHTGNIVNNRSNYYGGFLYASGDASVEHVGAITSNRSGHGGAIYAEDILLNYVEGDIANNIATNRGGVVVSESGSLKIQNIFGSISNNRASARGGAFYCDYHLYLSDLTGDIVGNNSGDYGGFIYSGMSANIRNVGGIRGNIGTYGGAVYTGVLTVDTVNGDIRNNIASEYGGGAFYADSSDSTVIHVFGNIEDNRAATDGGFMHGAGFVTIAHVTGSIRRNLAQEGAVLSVYAGDFVSSGLVRNGVIRNIGGDISDNTAGNLGGVAAMINGNGRMVIENVAGSITDNSAGYHGGVIYSLGYGAKIALVGGDLSNNSADSGSGGVVYATDESSDQANVVIDDVRGDVCSNTAGYYGGVVYTSAMPVSINKPGNGAIQYNAAQYGGGIVYNDGSAVHVDAGTGVIFSNSPNDVEGATEEVIEAGLVVDGASSLTILQQPGDGVERIPLEDQPVLSLPNSRPGADIPITVTLIDAEGVETLLPGPFDTIFTDAVYFQNLEIPYYGVNMTLRFSIGVPGCGHDDVFEVDTFSVVSSNFTIFECEYPHPVSCPSDIIVPTELHECHAFVGVPLPNSPRCSSPIISHDFSDSQLDEQALGDFEIGLNVVTYEMETTDGVSDVCVTHVTVFDSEAPQIQCGEDILAFVDSGECGATVDIPEPELYDNCPLDLIEITSSHPEPFFPVGSTSVSFTAIDSNGNTDVCTVTVTVVDNELPTIVCPEDIILPCGSPPTFVSPKGVDNCPGASTVQTSGPVLGSLNPLPSGITTFRFEVTDAANRKSSCSFTAEPLGNWYPDVDGDGIGDSSASAIVQCPAPGPNYVLDANFDCNDNDASLGLLLYPDSDADTFGNGRLPTCLPYDTLSAQLEITKRDADTVFFVTSSNDCDDTRFAVNPSVEEVCGNLIDDNCNGEIDEDCPIIISTTTVPTVPMPAAPLPPVPSVPAPIIVPTPLPRVPSPTFIDDPITVIVSDSAASSLSSYLALLVALAAFLLLC